MIEDKLAYQLTNGTPAARAKVLVDLMLEHRYPADCVNAAKALVNDNARVAFGTPVGWVAIAFLDLAGEEAYRGTNETIKGLIEANR